MSEDTSGAVIALTLVGVFTVACMCMMFRTNEPFVKTDNEILQSRIEGTLLSGDYTYIVDGTELSTLDAVTVANLHKYNVVMDTESKRVVLTTRPVNQCRTTITPIVKN